MKVLMFGWEFPPHNSGGLGVACRGLTRALTWEGTEVVFVLPRALDVKDRHMGFRFAGGSVKVHSVKSMLSPYMTPQEYEELRRAGYATDLFGEVMNYAGQAGEIARSEHFDVIHAHDWLAFPAGLAAKKATGKPLVLHVHLPALDQSGGHDVDPRVFAVEQESMMQADKIIAISGRIKDVLVNEYGIDPAKIETVYNGIDPDDIPEGENDANPFKGPGESMALFLGRLTLHKAPDKFLEASRIVSDSLPSAKFVVAGSGEMERQLMEQAASLGIGPKTLFPGFVRGREKGRLFRAADVFVMPSIREPFGLVALESLAGGTPAIVSKQSGVSEVLKNALKVDFWDVDELANKMLSILKYKPLKSHLTFEGEREARSSTWESAAKQCNSIYNACTSRS